MVTEGAKPAPPNGVEGYLHKRGPKGVIKPGLLRRRYFRSQGPLLSYRKNETDKIPLGQIDLVQCSSIKSAPSDVANDAGFLICGAAKTYTIICEHPAERNKWVVDLCGIREFYLENRWDDDAPSTAAEPEDKFEALEALVDSEDDILDDDEPERPESLEEAVATIGRLNKFSKAAMKRVFELEKKVSILNSELAEARKERRSVFSSFMSTKSSTASTASTPATSVVQRTGSVSEMAPKATRRTGTLKRSKSGSTSQAQNRQSVLPALPSDVSADSGESAAAKRMSVLPALPDDEKEDQPVGDDDPEGEYSTLSRLKQKTTKTMTNPLAAAAVAAVGAAPSSEDKKPTPTAKPTLQQKPTIQAKPGQTRKPSLEVQPPAPGGAIKKAASADSLSSMSVMNNVEKLGSFKHGGVARSNSLKGMSSASGSDSTGIKANPLRTSSKTNSPPPDQPAWESGPKTPTAYASWRKMSEYAKSKESINASKVSPWSKAAAGGGSVIAANSPKSPPPKPDRSPATSVLLSEIEGEFISSEGDYKRLKSVTEVQELRRFAKSQTANVR